MIRSQTAPGNDPETQTGAICSDCRADTDRAQAGQSRDCQNPKPGPHPSMPASVTKLPATAHAFAPCRSVTVRGTGSRTKEQSSATVLSPHSSKLLLASSQVCKAHMPFSSKPQLLVRHLVRSALTYICTQQNCMPVCSADAEIKNAWIDAGLFAMNS